MKTIKIPYKKRQSVKLDSMAKGKKKIAIDYNMLDVVPFLKTMGYNKIYEVEKSWKDEEDIHPWLNENKIRFFFTRNIGKRNKKIGDFTNLKGKKYVVYYIRLSAPAYRMAEYIDCILRKLSNQHIKTLKEGRIPVIYEFTVEELKALKC